MMMDIAEIRKKAKARSRADNDGLVSEPATGERVLPEAPSAQMQGDATEVSAVAQPETKPVVDAQVSDNGISGLDRLFAQSDEFALATEESFDDLLEYSAGIETQSSCQYLAFHLDEEEYALDIKQISEIIKVREFTDIPRAPEFILGIISLRGVVVPVFDLRRRLNLGVSELMSSTRIIVCQLEDMTIGLLVDSINQVVNLIDDEIEPPPGVLSGLDREMVTGIGRYHGRLIILLNLNNVLDVVSL